MRKLPLRRVKLLEDEDVAVEFACSLEQDGLDGSFAAREPRETLTRGVTLHSSRTRLTGVKAANVEARPWIQKFPVCPSLNQHQILHVGVMEAQAPTCVVRMRQTTAYFLATIAGSGKVLVDGQWKVCDAGHACLLPAEALNAFSAVPGTRWKFCWVCYEQPPGQGPVATNTSAVMQNYDGAPLHFTITGLLHETQHESEPILLQNWIDLIHNYVLRFVQPLNRPDPLRLLWERVAATLIEDWTLDRLTKESGYSREHLRRLCHSRLGRGPVHQVTHMRLRRAVELLQQTNHTVESIAAAVGYRNLFAFSNAFKRGTGWWPTEYRQRRVTRS